MSRSYVAKWLVAAPLVHLLIVSVYMVWFNLGFGGAVPIYDSVNDLFLVAVTEIAPLYIIYLPVSLFFTIVLFVLYKIKEASGFYNKSVLDYDSTITVGFFVLLPGFIFTILFIFIIGVVSLNYYLKGVANLFGMVVGIVIIFLFTIFHVVSHFKYVSKIGTIFLALSVVLVSTVSAGGHINGQKYRHVLVKDIGVNSPTCGKFKIIKSNSKGYLVISSDDRKHIVNSSCDVVVSFPVARVRGYLGWSWRPIYLID